MYTLYTKSMYMYDEYIYMYTSIHTYILVVYMTSQALQILVYVPRLAVGSCKSCAGSSFAYTRIRIETSILSPHSKTKNSRKHEVVICATQIYAYCYTHK